MHNLNFLNSTSVPTPWLECMHASVHVILSTWLHVCSNPYAYLHGNMGSSMWHCVCVLQSSHFWSHTLVRMCICTCTYVHLTPNITSNPFCIVTWKHGCPCVALCLCSNHLISVSTPCLECVHTAVHLFMPTWLPISPQTLMHNYMETWVLMCGKVCMFHSVHFWSHTLFRISTYLSKCIYVNLTPEVWSTPFA